MENSQSPSGFSASGIALVISFVLAIQAIFATGLAIWLSYEAIVQDSGSLPAILFEVVMLVAFAGWSLLSGIHVRRFSGWSRASIICIEVLWAAVGFGFNQGEWANPVLAIVLVVPAALVLFLLFVAPMRKAFADNN